MITIHYCVVPTNNHIHLTIIAIFKGKGVLMICFFKRGGVDFKGNKTVFRGSMDINFSGTKGGK